MESPSPKVLARRFCHPFSMRLTRRGLAGLGAPPRNSLPAPPPGCSDATTREQCTGSVRERC
jgi:hypothetical protein